jgi:acyl-CoA synthetase (AMP-forming)/AMP-acid ligase II
MVNTITRNFISDNFVFTDIRSESLKTYDKENLIEKINLWKYILKYQYNAVAQESILIGMQVININYFAIVIAAAELSLKIVVVDYNRTDKFRTVEYKDPKTKLLSPIDIFLHDFPDNTIETDQVYAKFVFFKTHSRRTYSTDSSLTFTLIPELYKNIESIMPQPSDVLFRVTSSGTTDIPKVIEHTHEFISSISLRNAKHYKGTAVHINNLNHGASASVTLLPLLASKNVDKHLFYDGADTSSINGLIDALMPYKDEIGYMSFPYPFLIDKFIEVSREKNISWPQLELITLSYILDNAKHAVRDGIFNSITSMFGSNETLGPLFVNTSYKENWNVDSRYYIITDDFYNIKLSDEGKITVTIPIYNKDVETNDYFDKDGEYFIHRGRSDMFRINGETINMSTVNDLNKQNTSVYIVVDTVYHCLYLACWEDLELDTIHAIKDSIESKFERIKITKIAHLDKSNFYYAIKIDNELLREYFRTHNVS